MTPWLRTAVVFVVGIAGTAVVMQLDNNESPADEATPAEISFDPEAPPSSLRSAADTAIVASEPSISPTTTTILSPTEAVADTERFTDPVEVHTDDHHHPDLAPPGETAAAVVAVATFSWRFDHQPDRLTRTAAPFATQELLASLEPDAAEIERRQQTSEVSWAVVLDHTVNGPTHNISITRRWVSDTRSESTQTRHLVVTVDGNQVTHVVEPTEGRT